MKRLTSYLMIMAMAISMIGFSACDDSKKSKDSKEDKEKTEKKDKDENSAKGLQGKWKAEKSENGVDGSITFDFTGENEGNYSANAVAGAYKDRGGVTMDFGFTFSMTGTWTKKDDKLILTHDKNSYNPQITKLVFTPELSPEEYDQVQTMLSAQILEGMSPKKDTTEYTIVSMDDNEMVLKNTKETLTFKRM